MNYLRGKPSVDTVEKGYMSTLRTKTVIESGETYDKFQKLTSVPPMLKMDYSVIYDKPFFLGNYVWQTTDTVGHSPITIYLPDFMAQSVLARIPFDASALFRLRACILLQVSGTPMHAGCMVVSSLPMSADIDVPDSFLQAPHVFLNANESTSVCLEVPFYAGAPLLQTTPSSTHVVSLHSDNAYALIHSYIMNPLVTAAGTTTLTISAHLVVREAEFYVPKSETVSWNNIPHFAAESFVNDMYKIPTKVFDGVAYGVKEVTGDFIDALRKGVRQFTGFHNPNDTQINHRVITTHRNFTNYVDGNTQLEKMNNISMKDRITRDTLFCTDVDEMDLRHILSKPCHVGSITLDAAETEGTVLFAQPITPFVQAAYPTPTGPQYGTFSAPMRLFYESSRYWRGGLKLHIQSVMTNFQYCKLMVVKNYATDVRNLNATLDFSEVHNLMTDTLEFSAGGQVQTVDLPYCSQLEQLECTKDLVANALCHGIYTVYLMQPLVNNGSSPTTAKFNFYISAADDFQFYGYATDRFVHAAHPGTFKAEAEVTVEPSQQHDIINQDVTTNVSHLRFDDFTPNTSVRDYLRRVIPVTSYTVGETVLRENYGVVPIRVTDLFGNRSLDTDDCTSHHAIHSLFHGWNGGLKVKINISSFAKCKVSYVPPGSGLDLSDKVFKATYAVDTNNFMAYQYDTLVPTSQTFQEEPNTTHGTSGGRYTQNFEFIIPNMNPFKFTTVEETTVINEPYKNAMGTIILAYDFPADVATRPSIMTICIGFTDETRHGFQVKASHLSNKLYTSGGAVYRYSTFNPAGGNGFSVHTPPFGGAYFMGNL